VDPFSLLLLAQGAVGAIKAGCDMLSQGRAVINDFKGDAENIVSEVKATIETVTGLWDWVQNLFKFTKPEVKFTKPDVTLISKGNTTKSIKKKQVDPDAETLQMQVVHEVSQNLGKFFDIQQQITSHYKNLEDDSLHVYEANQNHAMKAIERVEVELQLENLTVQIRETMVYAPMELKDLYTRFLKMYGRIKEEQEFARQEQLRKARNEKAQRWQLRNNRIDRLWATAGVALAVLWIWGLTAGLIWQQRTLTGFWLD
jgi:hypothetical protein